MPTQKSPQVEDFLTQFAGISRQEAAAKSCCTFCRQLALEFKDVLSVREYQISGLCQSCQDYVFCPEENL
jgi:hypothetical protein